MKKRDSLLLILSISCVSSLVGYSSWITGYKYSYSQTNKVQSIPVAYIVGKEDIKYTSIEKALDVAKSGDIVCVIAPQLANYNDQTNKILPDKVTYKISRNCTIKEGVTLFIPTDKVSEGSVNNSKTLSTYIENLKKPKRDQGSSGYDSFAENDPSKYLRVSIEIEAGKTLTNNGTLLISGYLSGGTSNAGCVGQTSHSYSRIVLNDGASIVQKNNNAKTYCFGFIEEKTTNNNSILDLQMGKLYIPVVINDYRGFNYSYAMTNGAIDKERCSVFNEIEFRNVKCLSKISYNSSVEGIINIYVNYSTLGVDETITVEKGVVGTTSSYLIQQTEPSFSHIIYKYNSIDNTLKAKCYGGFNFNYLAIDLAMKGQKLKLSTQEAYFPLSYKFDVELLNSENQDSAIFNVSNQRMKLMTGCKVYIGDNVKLSGNELVVYSALYDGEKGKGQNVLDSGRPVYPLKENGILQVADSGVITMNKLAGNVFCNIPSNITANANTITSKEPWDLGNSGSLTVPWTIKNFLEINEELSVVNSEYLSKDKICVGVNIFSNSNSYKPSFNVKMNDNSRNINVNGMQKIIYEDAIANFSFNLISNIYTIFHGSAAYKNNSVVQYNSNNKLVCVTNSDREILNNNNGINEFDVQSVNITCTTPLVDGKVPLYVDSAIQLRATVDDINKSYDKTIVWSSSDEEIAVVDQNGKVTGKKLGDVIISATCGGVVGTYPTKVIPSVEIAPISSITIADNKKNSATMNTSSGASQSFNFSNKYGNNQNINFTLSLNDGAKWASIERTLKASQAGRQYINDSNQPVNTVNDTEKITIHTGSGTGLSDDGFSLTIKVAELGTGKIYLATLNLIHKADACVVYGTKIALIDGTEKNVENLTIKDDLLVFNHDQGELSSSQLFFNYHQNEDNIVTAPILKLSFENGNYIEIHVDHGFFNYTRKEYVYINKDNYMKFINDEFIFLEKTGKLGKTRLLKGNVKVKTVRVYSPVSVYHLNVFTNGFLSITGEIEGWFNYFDCNDSLKFNEEKKKKDIERYGLYEYEDFKDYIRKEIFDLLPIPYLKVSVGKGLTTKENIIKVMKKYLSFM